MSKPTHKDTTRLTAKERAMALLAGVDSVGGYRIRLALIERALQAHARQALERKARR